jgi:conjugative transfer region protein TrbK
MATDEAIMTGRVLVRLGLVGALAASLIAAAIAVGCNRDNDAKVRPGAREVGTVDPHRQALKRCQNLGEAAIHDATCLKVWAESRKRFMGIETPLISREVPQQSPANMPRAVPAPGASSADGPVDPIGKL